MEQMFTDNPSANSTQISRQSVQLLRQVPTAPLYSRRTGSRSGDSCLPIIHPPILHKYHDKAFSYSVKFPTAPLYSRRTGARSERMLSKYMGHK
ncbi:hypothetical protein J6590_076273 [Homalodisca vitripennis]|nr:hypothetical protein J6590_076273 [Homalodisca vitripennis]